MQDKVSSSNSWENISERIKEGDRRVGLVTRVVDYGCFIEIEEGVEGLALVSELDWVNRDMHPSSVADVGEKIEVEVLEINESNRRLFLGVKQCTPNPWLSFEQKYKPGDKVSATIISFTIFGIYVNLEDGVHCLIHDSDISIDMQGYDKGSPIECTVLQISAERERISLKI